MGKFVLAKDLWVNGSFLWVRALLLPLSSIAVGRNFCATGMLLVKKGLLRGVVDNVGAGQRLY
jgi:hypothetical protein